jgi:acyl-CoA synthetase (AMP-forming)/AMP-acid ligase II
MSISQRIDQVLQLSPESWAIEFQGRTSSWGALAAARDELGALLRSAGVADGCSIGLLGRNRLDVVTAFIGIVGLDRTITLLNPARPETQVVAEIESLELACLVGGRNDLTDAVLAAARAAGTMVVLADEEDGLTRFEVVTAGRRGAAFREAGAGTQIEIQTSGTTGPPKRIAIARKTLEASLRGGVRTAAGEAATETLGVKASPTLMFGPLVHTSGTFGVLMSIFEARPLVLFEKFDTAEFIRKLRQFRPKFTALPPTALAMLLDSDATRDDLSSLIAVRSGSAPLPVATQERFEQKFGVPVLTNYGATEFMGTVAGWTLDDYRQWGPAKRGSVGRANRGVALRITDPADGSPLPPGQPGVLEVRAERLQGDGSWIRTSDLAMIDADGFLFIQGRLDDAIIRGGFKVMAGKVADVLRLHEAVADVIVLGVPDERLGQVPVAVLELRPGATLGAVELGEQLRAFARERLVAYEVPVSFVAVAQLPRTVSGKVSRPDALAMIPARGEVAA